MRRNLFLTAVAGLIVPAASALGATISLTDNVAPTNEISIDVVSNPTGSITLNIDFSGVVNMGGIDLRLMSLDGTTLFSITGRDLTVSGLTDPHFATVSGSPVGDLNAVNDRNIGATVSDAVGGPFINGSGTALKVTLSYANLVAGNDYRIQVVGDDANGTTSPQYSDNNFEAINFEVGPNYIVHATPEPGSVLLLAAAGVPALLRRRRSA